jgi:hypothetical protein
VARLLGSEGVAPTLVTCTRERSLERSTCKIRRHRYCGRHLHCLGNLDAIACDCVRRQNHQPNSPHHSIRFRACIEVLRSLSRLRNVRHNASSELHLQLCGEVKKPLDHEVPSGRDVFLSPNAACRARASRRERSWSPHRRKKERSAGGRGNGALTSLLSPRSSHLELRTRLESRNLLNFKDTHQQTLYDTLTLGSFREHCRIWPRCTRVKVRHVISRHWPEPS